MKKKILSLFMVIAITIFQFMPTMVSALSYDLEFENSVASQNPTGYNSYSITSDVVTLYVGNISVDGTSTLKYLYTDKSVNTATLNEIDKILTGDYKTMLPTTAGQIKVSNDNTVTVNDVFTDAGMVAVNKYPDGTVTDTSSTILYNTTDYNNLTYASSQEISDEATAEANNLSAYNSRKATWDAAEQEKVNNAVANNTTYTPVEFPEEYVKAFDDSTTYPTDSYFHADVKTNSLVGANNSNSRYILRNGKITRIDYYNIDRTIIKVVNTSANVTTTSSEPHIIRQTTTIYHTRVVGALNITGTDTYSKNYNSGENYTDGNYTDSNIATIINGYKEDMNTVSGTYFTTPTFDEGLSDYYFEAHDEITQSGTCPTNMNDINNYPDCTITINTILDKYQTYSITGTATAKNIKSVSATIKAPVIGDTATATTKPSVTLEDGANYEIDHIAYITAYPSAMATGYDEPFVGTFEADTDYYVEVSLVAKDGYKFRDNDHITLKVNGKSTNFEMNQYNADGSTYYMFYAKVKATTPTYEFIEGAGQKYILVEDDTATFRVDADFNLFENGGAVYVDDELVPASKYTAESGSTKITFTKDYMNSLSVGTHNLKVVFNNGGTAETTFTIAEKTSSNPQTGDNIMFYISMLGFSIIGLAGAGLYLKKKRFN